MPEACEFALGSPHAPRSALLVRFAGDLFAPNRPLLEAVDALMRRVHDDFEYRAQTTDVATDALQALQLRRGVCQDFAHVMIAVCRSMGLAGPLRQRLPVDAAARRASRGWWAAMPRTPGCRCGARQQGWVDFDPTNNLRPALDHVTLAWGRDYGDVAPLRGVIRGGTAARPQVQVTVEPSSRRESSIAPRAAATARPSSITDSA